MFHYFMQALKAKRVSVDHRAKRARLAHQVSQASAVIPALVVNPDLLEPLG